MRSKITAYVSKEAKNDIQKVIKGLYGITPIKSESQLIEFAVEKLLQEIKEDYEKKVKS